MTLRKPGVPRACWVWSLSGSRCVPRLHRVPEAEAGDRNWQLSTKRNSESLTPKRGHSRAQTSWSQRKDTQGLVRCAFTEKCQHFLFFPTHVHIGFCASVRHMCGGEGSCGGQKRALDPLELKPPALQVL